jgi:hypothetical protein|tara:strand:+ start:1933 stop:2124 length:192 start_codon:yes stop_codon:yes gene_type:complete
MPRVAPEDRQSIAHIKFICESIHDFGDELYENLMDRNYDEARVEAQKLHKVLSELIVSLSDEI